MDWILALVLGYALGSVPFGLLITRLAGAGDLRSIGSGNIGATNVLRTGRKGLAAATLLLDLLKGLVAVLVVAHFWPQWTGLAALAVFVGHCFPVWLSFRGGKGVATTAGVAFGLAWPVGLAYAVTWLGLLATVRISSVAGMSAAVVAPIAALALGHRDAALVLAVIAAIVLFQHRENIARLRAGTEPRVGSGKKA
ncbi:glycerol-3-phosphate 1-O-acyltransferase PlsY [Novosphingobium mangrovi (ex Huang et al. 2023)]|uniref:Glycerol-3-phosphate acyltransferase n=1 Tax=Novosphingobium mangrovi (ex Huang et al. 2023) TaxID=2976432 RepID=A0ABT2I410_9SPHN|nr:glycerol-3-phosphate 1-O-acyltransferase PlsY [Novosphingobium mangrovi (ex Huang et al. 2023)]MCT2399373.1 glycerol-3-phosphate 1-O-acyltransferase PlsY [Novosphingobium mangrovi (ex Huang et al. 2023)]